MNSHIPITPQVKNYLQMQNFFAWIGLIAPVAMVFFLMNFFPLPFSWNVIELVIYFFIPAFVSLVVFIFFFKSTIESGKGIQLLCLAFKIILYLVLLVYFFTFVYSVVVGNGLTGYYYSFTSIVYYGMYLLSFFFLVLAIRANSLLINSLNK